MGIKHLEDLSVDDFVKAMTDLDSFTVTEKVDGSNLVFGFDSDGRFYTSREHKGGKRYYGEGEYQKAFWTTSFRSAHAFLQQNKETLYEVMGDNSAIEAEILYGRVPNTIPYLDIVNKVVALRVADGKFDISLIECKYDHLVLPDVSFTQYGYDFYLQECRTTWKFRINPIIENIKIPEVIYTKLQEFITYINENSNDLTNLEMSKKRISSKNKTEVLNIRNIIMSKKLEIKQIMFESLVKDRASAFAGITQNQNCTEGLVFSSNEMCFKLVDKEAFTKQNAKMHEVDKNLKENYWKPLKRSLYEIMGLNKSDKKLRKYLEDYRELIYLIDDPYGDIKERARNLCCDSIKNLMNMHSSMISYNFKTIHHQNKAKEQIAGLIQRIRNLDVTIASATCLEHLAEAILTEEISAEHKKHFTDSTRPIHKEEIPVILDQLSKMIGYNIVSCLLGSTGKKDISGDIDVGIDSNHYQIDEIYEILKDKLPEDKIKYSKGLQILHIEVPIPNDIKNAQVDLLFSDNFRWLKFWYSSEPDKSKYKGLYRNALLRAAVAATNKVERCPETNEIIVRHGYTVVPHKGLVYQSRSRHLGLRGQRLKSFKVDKEPSILALTEPLVILHQIGVDLVNPSIELLNTYENLARCIREYFEISERNLIREIFIKILEQKKRPIPKEFLYNVI